jgi:tmRNA-binding protein
MNIVYCHCTNKRQYTNKTNAILSQNSQAQAIYNVSTRRNRLLLLHRIKIKWNRYLGKQYPNKEQFPQAQTRETKSPQNMTYHQSPV